jgi:hypothetical protein
MYSIVKEEVPRKVIGLRTYSAMRYHHPRQVWLRLVQRLKVIL